MDRNHNSGGGETRTGRILVVDDNLDNAEIIATRLRYRGYTIEEASDGASAIAAVYREPPDLMLLDIMLPDMDGFEVSRRIRGDASLPFFPIILVTARDSAEDKVMGIDAGADDYLTKPITFTELEARVRAMLRIKRLQDELEEKNRELRRLSVSDGLTGLFNHRHIHGLLREEYERAVRSGAPLTVAMFDLDHFKLVNDTWGHQAGDRVLQETANILRLNAREVDRLGRYGGEEFIAILPATNSEGGATFVERVRLAVEQHVFRIRDDADVRMTLSAGIASFSSESTTDAETHHTGAEARITNAGTRISNAGTRISNAETLISKADDALYVAKSRGRNRFERFDRLGHGPGDAPDED